MSMNQSEHAATINVIGNTSLRYGLLASKLFKETLKLFELQCWLLVLDHVTMLDQWQWEATVTLLWGEMRLDDWAELALMIVPGPAPPTLAPATLSLSRLATQRSKETWAKTQSTAGSELKVQNFTILKFYRSNWNRVTRQQQKLQGMKYWLWASLIFSENNRDKS